MEIPLGKPGPVMRLWLTAIIVGVCAAGPAAASSFVAPSAPEPGSSPSIVFLGEPAAGAPEPVASPAAPANFAGTAQALEQEHRSAPPAALPYQISPSILSYGEPAVEDVKVSSISDDSDTPRRTLPPMVIRGGIVGDAFASSASADPAPSSPHEEPAQASAPAEEPGPSPQPEAPERQPAAPQPAPSRPPPGGLDVPR